MKTIRDMNKIVLASASPRRKELLRQMGLEFEVIVSDAEEIITKTAPGEIVMELSQLKAKQVVYKVAMDSLPIDGHPARDILIIGADTIVAYGSEILGKPKSEEDAFRMIKLLEGKQHGVYTGVTMVYVRDGVAQTRSFFEETKVYVTHMTDSQIRNYIDTHEPMDKAGAYAIQGRFAEFIEKIDGDYNNVVGLPVGRIMRECVF